MILERLIKPFWFLLLSLVAGQIQAQQDPLNTLSQYDLLRINPGYAGASDHLTLQAVYRAQWLGIEGGPRTVSFAAHTPLRNDRVGLGLAAWSDGIGADHRNGLQLAYAYRFPLSKEVSAALGLQAGLESFSTDITKLNLQTPSDGAFLADQYQWLLPSVGAGIFLHSELFYAGISVPQLIQHELLPDPISAGVYQYNRHFYLTGGLVVPVNREWKVRASLLLRSLLPGSGAGAPWSLDLNGALLYRQILWLGLVGRSGWASNTLAVESLDIWFSVQLEQGLRLGLSYDWMLTPLADQGRGSVEAMLGYEFDLRTRKVAMPSYF